MAEALLITRQDLVKYTAVNGNLDADNFIQFIKLAQDIHAQNYLGTQLLKKLKQLIVDGEVDDVGNEDYKTLLIDYVKPCLIHWAMNEYLPWAAYKISNKGIYKHSSENAQNVDKEEVDFLVSKEKIIAGNYAERLVEYLSNNGSLYPEYNNNQSGDVFPDSNSFYTNWFI